MKKGGNEKKRYWWMLVGMSLLCLAGMSAAGCGKRDVSYVKDGTENADEAETTAEADAAPDTWEFFYPAKMESGNIVSVRIKVDIGDVPEASEVMGIRRTVLEESTKRQIAETVLGDEVSFEDGVYTGSRDGILYQMKIGERRISFYPEDLAQIAPQYPPQMKEAVEYGLNAESGSGNRCEMSAEEAEGLAMQFLEEIGFSDRIFCNMESLVWIGTIGQPGEDTRKIIPVTDGYVIFFEQTLKGDQVPQFSGDTEQEILDLWLDEREYISGRQMKMHTVLCMDDHGVIAMDIFNLYEITSIEENVSLLPVSTVCDIMEKELTDHADRYIGHFEDDLYYKKLSFGYCLLWDDADECGSYVPVWELDDSVFELDSSKIVVNAIDGSIIPLEQRGG